MSFFYADTPASSGPVSIKRMKATKAYLRHYDIRLQLMRIALKATDARDKAQAMKEITVAERKMAWWERKENFDLAEALVGIAELKRSGNASVNA